MEICVRENNILSIIDSAQCITLSPLTILKSTFCGIQFGKYIYCMLLPAKKTDTTVKPLHYTTFLGFFFCSKIGPICRTWGREVEKTIHEFDSSRQIRKKGKNRLEAALGNGATKEKLIQITNEIRKDSRKYWQQTQLQLFITWV